MNPIRISAAVLFLLFATFAYAQEQREEPPSKQEEVKPSKETKESKPSKAEKQDMKQDTKQDMKQDTKKPAKQGASEQAQERHGRPAGKSAHIPDAKFHASFGRQHTFVVRQPVIVEGQPRFQYSGYWFEIVDPWPAGWAYTDDCYIDYVDGEYFLFDVLHPGVSVALFVVM
ncbi:MAG: hypothetical protein WCB94_09355 [Terriglobales bacterium]